MTYQRRDEWIRVIGVTYSAVMMVWVALKIDYEWVRWFGLYAALFFAGASGWFIRKLWETRQRAADSRDHLEPGAASSPGVSR